MEARMKTDFSTDVLICGAGAAGLTLAVDLARRGLSFRLIDKAEGPFEGSRGKGIQPRTQEVFEDLGVLNAIAARGGPYPPQLRHLEDGTGRLEDSFERGEPTPAEPYRSPLLAPQFATENVLRDRLNEFGRGPEFGRELIGLTQDEHGATARVAGRSGETTIRARYLIGADGGRSFVRSALGVGFPGKTLGARAVVADVVMTGLGRDVWHRFNRGAMDQQISFCPLPHSELFQLQAPVPLEGDIDATAGGLSRMTAERTRRDDVRIVSAPWASVYAMNARLADSYRQGRAFLVGDAAHIHPPTGGQGLNTSVQDAYNLGWKLAAVLNGAPAALLDSYEEERRPIAAGMLGLSSKLLEAAKQGDMRRGRDVQQLDLGYEGSSLALDGSDRGGGLRAGERAPDAPVRGAAGQKLRLFDLFSGPHWTLLGDAVDREIVPSRPGLRVHRLGPDGDLRDEDGAFQEAYGLGRGDWALVRPDGYVAAIVSSGQRETLEAYLCRVGLGSARI
jgi:2-polyprenyl-6-methoxyphenol hydroxylase-like FAD-dependent oxidoreductase